MHTERERVHARGERERKSKKKRREREKREREFIIKVIRDFERLQKSPTMSQKSPRLSETEQETLSSRVLAKGQGP